MHIHKRFKALSTHEELTEEHIQTWLIEQICGTTSLTPDKIDINEPFSSYGLDSVAAVGLSGELSNWLGEPLVPTITWDYPTVKLLAQHVASTFVPQLLVASLAISAEYQ